MQLADLIKTWEDEVVDLKDLLSRLCSGGFLLGWEATDRKITDLEKRIIQLKELK